jgi:cell division protein FtsI/penicillin-binding protein 2
MSYNLETLITRTVRYFRRLDRIGQVWYIIVWYIGLLIITVFWYSVIEHGYYAKFADAQQKSIIENPASRWNIASSSESLGWVLAVSTNLGTLAIDPTQSWSRDKLLTFLSDIVFEEFCARTRSACRENIGSYLRTDLSEEKDITESSLKERIREYISIKMDTPIESVEIKQDLDEATIDTIVWWWEESLFFIANNLKVNPTKVKDGVLLANRLAPLLNIPVENIMPKFTPRKNRHLGIIQKMSIGTRDIVNKRIESELLAIKESRLEKTDAIYPFLIIEDNLMRFYPEGRTLGQITGFIDGKWKWQYGIEGYFDSLLQIENPRQTVVKDIAWRPIRDYVSTNLLTLRSGVDMTLTIDRNLQKELSKILSSSVQEYRANKGSAIVMNPKTWAILAMVNYPDYDPNSFPEVYEMERVLYATYPNPVEDLRGYPLFVEDNGSWSLSVNIEWKRYKLRSATDAEIENFAIIKYKYKNGFGASIYQNEVVSSLYEPGSVFKAITTAIGIDTGEIKPDDIYYDKGYVELDLGWRVKKRISNVSSNCIGRHSYISALNWSCNVGMISIVEKIGKSLFHQYIVDFGFSSKTNITLDGETYAQIWPHEKWPRVQFFTMSFGHWINVTMLQMATAYSVIANGWVYMQPYIVESILYPDGKRIETVPTPLRRVIKEDTAKQVVAMLVDSVRNWFAKAGWVPGYTVAGKTGTSQIAFRGWYEIGQAWHTITSYGWFAPAQSPKFVLIVRLDRPRSSVYSETTSSALFSKMTKYLLEYYKVPKNS